MLKKVFFTGSGMFLGAKLQVAYHDQKIYILNRRFVECSKEGNLEFIKKTLSDPDLTKETKNEAVEKSIEQDQLEVFEYLLKELHADQNFLKKYKADIWSTSKHRRSFRIMEYLKQNGISDQYEYGHAYLGGSWRLP